MISKKVLLVVGAAAVFVLALMPASTLADNLTISLQQGVGPVSTCADGAACDTAFLGGVVAFNISGVDFNLGGIGAGTPAMPAGSMDLSYNLTDTFVSPGGVYTLLLTENNVTGPLTPLSFSALNNGNQTSNVTTAFTVYVDSSNALFGTGTILCSAPPANSVVVDLSCGGAFTNGSNPYSLTEKIVLTTPPGFASASGDALLTPVPEPGTLSMLGFGLLSFVGIFRRKLLA